MLQPLPKDIADLLKIQTARLDSLRNLAARDVLREVIRARAFVVQRINAMRLAGRDTFTAAQQRAILIELDRAVDVLAKRVGIVLDRHTDLLVDRAVRDAVAQVALVGPGPALAAPTIGYDQAARILAESKLRQVEAERMRRGAQKYAVDTVQALEGDLAQSVLTGETTHAAVQRITSGKTWSQPAWKAERLVRTEVSHAYNGAAESVLSDVAEGDPGLWLMWHEHAAGPTWAGPTHKAWKGPARPLDDRVGDDSLRLHGQLRRPGEVFVDPETGKTFAHPPSRPYGRETIVLVRVDKAGRLVS